MYSPSVRSRSSMGFTLEISMGGKIEDIEGWEPVPRWLWCFCGQFV